MSRDYAESRIKEALQATGGNTAKARRQVMAWAHEDQRLLLQLAQPHLGGIIAHAVHRAIDKINNPQTAYEPDETPQPALPSDIEGASEIGAELLKNIVGEKGETFGLEGGAAPRKRGGASQQHINAINQIARRIDPDSK